jgi:hypothetical protein
MTSNLTQKGMTSNFTGNTEGDFYWRLKYPCQNQGNPENETALTAKHKRVSPIRAFARREHEHENFSFLAVILTKHTSPILWVRDSLFPYLPVKIISYLKSGLYIDRLSKI